MNDYPTEPETIYICKMCGELVEEGQVYCKECDNANRQDRYEADCEAEKLARIDRERENNYYMNSKGV